MNSTKRTGAVVCAIALGWVTSAVAVQPLEMTNAIVLESSTPNQLVVTGHNFNNGGTVQLTLGGTPLIVTSQTDTVLVADLPDSVLPGSYVLVAWSGNGSVREDSMDITIGAEGPAGPQGEVGPAGQDGALGADGAPGQDGAPGADGSSCSATDTLDGALISCTDGTSATVFDGSDGVDGLPGVKGDTGDRGPPGPPGSDGLPGLPGTDGQDGSSCSVADGDGFATISCDDGTTATVNDGAQGPEGPQGPQGPPGLDGTSVDRSEDICNLFSLLIQNGTLPGAVSLPPYCGRKLVFVTDALFRGDFSGGGSSNVAANAACQAEANAAGLPGEYRAWIGISEGSNINGLNLSSFPYFKPDKGNIPGEMVALNKADLLDGDIVSPINRNAFGFSPLQPGTGSVDFVWSGLDASGQGLPLDPFLPESRTCESWTVGADIPVVSGHFGLMIANDSSWASGGTQSCASVARFYCFQQ